LRDKKTNPLLAEIDPGKTSHVHSHFVIFRTLYHS